MNAGPEMDALVASRIFGLDVRGVCRVFNYDGSASIDTPDSTEHWPFGGALRPCYVDGCDCADGPLVLTGEGTTADRETLDRINATEREKWESDRAIWGHHRFCLSPVPAYSTDDGEAMKVMDRVAARGPFGFKLERCITQCDEAPVPHWYAEGPRQQSVIAETAAHAICLAALQACGVEV